MPVRPVATLSSKGYVRSITDKVDRLMAYFFASDANQDHNFKGEIANLSILLQECGNEVLQFRERLRASLEQYMGRNFDTAVVAVWDDSDTNYSDRINVKFSVMVTEAGERYDVANQLTLVNGKFEKITQLNNTGSANYL